MCLQLHNVCNSARVVIYGRSETSVTTSRSESGAAGVLLALLYHSWLLALVGCTAGDGNSGLMTDLD
jgi:hypothetical protein